MKSSRRHDSLIPLSREHHYALMFCLRVHRGVKDRRDDLTWLRRKADDAAQLFTMDLTPHFRAEEEILFPAMKNFEGATDLISDLLDDHRSIENLIEGLRNADDSSLADALNRFADTLEAHIRREERELFPIFESQAGRELERVIEIEITKMIGEALQPRDPELLK